MSSGQIALCRAALASCVARLSMPAFGTQTHGEEVGKAVGRVDVQTALGRRAARATQWVFDGEMVDGVAAGAVGARQRAAERRLGPEMHPRLVAQLHRRLARQQRGGAADLAVLGLPARCRGRSRTGRCPSSRWPRAAREPVPHRLVDRARDQPALRQAECAQPGEARIRSGEARAMAHEPPAQRRRPRSPPPRPRHLPAHDRPSIAMRISARSTSAICGAPAGRAQGQVGVDQHAQRLFQLRPPPVARLPLDPVAARAEDRRAQLADAGAGPAGIGGHRQQAAEMPGGGEAERHRRRRPGPRCGAAPGRSRAPSSRRPRPPPRRPRPRCVAGATAARSSGPGGAIRRAGVERQLLQHLAELAGVDLPRQRGDRVEPLGRNLRPARPASARPRSSSRLGGSS